MGERARRLLRRAVLALVWGAAGYYLLFGGEYSHLELQSLQAERDSLAARVDSVVATADSLESRAERLASDPFAIERTARERYGFVKDDERLYRFVEVADGEGGTPVDGSGKRR